MTCELRLRLRRVSILARLCSIFAVPACSDPFDRDPEDYTCRLSVDPSLHPRAGELQAALEREVAGRVPGAVWAVRDREGLWLGAFGHADLDLAVPMRACQRFRIASVTKPMVATAVLRLAELGDVDLDAPLFEALPEPWADRFDDPDSTLRNALRHRTGLPRFRDTKWGLEVFDDPGRTWSTDDFLHRALDKKREFAPGTGYTYSNTNYLLAGKVIERATGSGHDAFIAREVFEAVGMTDASYVADDPRAPESALARGYLDVWGDHRLYDATESFAVTDSTAAGGAVASALDLQRFIDALLRDKTVLDPNTVEAMLDLQPTGDPDFAGYGLGIESWDTPWGRGLGHTGQRFGYLARVHWFPERDITMVLLVNASSLSSPTDDNLTGLVYDQLSPNLLATAVGPE